jgi:hypothetical protein
MVRILALLFAKADTGLLFLVVGDGGELVGGFAVGGRTDVTPRTR